MNIPSKKLILDNFNSDRNIVCPGSAYFSYTDKDVANIQQARDFLSKHPDSYVIEYETFNVDFFKNYDFTGEYTIPLDKVVLRVSSSRIYLKIYFQNIEGYISHQLFKEDNKLQSTPTKV